MMNKRRIFLNAMALITGSMLLSSCGYNSLVEEEEAVNEKWAQVENVYQRRLDLIPNLVETVKGYAEVEKEILIGVTKARAGALTAMENSKGGKNLEAFQSSQRRVGMALGNLLGYVEKYPNLKSNQGFLSLQAQLEGTENRIAVERKRYNEVVRTFNTRLKKFPTNIIWGSMFEPREYFTADEGANKAPKVKF